MSGVATHERSLRRWMEERGMVWDPLRYPREAAGGEVSALRLRPEGEAVARVVLAHGGGNSALFPLVGITKTLLRAGLEVFAFDLDGHGPRSTTTLSPETLPGSIPAALERARSLGDPLPLHLLGHSLGGSLALRALADGVEVASAVVISAPISIHPGPAFLLEEMRGMLTPTCLSHREHYGLWGLVPALGPLKRSDYPVRLARAAAGGLTYVEAVRETLAALHLEADGESAAAPALLVYGERDRLVPVEQGERLAAAFRRSRLLRVPGATHYTTVLREDVARETLSWIRHHSLLGQRG